MLIVCTADADIVQTALDPDSDSGAWGEVIVLHPQLNMNQATAGIAQALNQLQNGEPLCFSAHGSNEEIGDIAWRWSFRDVAGLLVQNTNGYRDGLILIHACASRIVNFSAHLAVELDTWNEQNQRQDLAGTWVYGYNRAVPVNARFPRPELVSQQVDLQGTQVR